MRAVRIKRFDAGTIQDDWLELRELAFVKPDAAWSTTLDEVSAELMDACIDRQLFASLGSGPVAPDELPDFDVVRAANGLPVRARISEARYLVRGWSDREHVELPAMWTTDSFDGEVRQRLERGGALDFRELSDDDLARWLHTVGAWPKGMVLSLDPSANGLTDEELHAQETAEAHAKAEKERAARRVNFQGVDVDLDSSMSNLVNRVSDFLESSPASLTTRYRMSGLHDVAGAKRAEGTRRGAHGGASGRNAANRLSNEQTRAIGLAGEMIAFHWLKNRDPSRVDESCWKSGNARFVIAGAIGDDSLGYDFAVPRKNGPVMYEVKATTGDAGMIELGETEVRCAQEFSGNDLRRLLIVEAVLTTTPRIHMLPNPFHRDNRSQFSFVGNSVRLRFSLT